jgi:hypothetical protein
LFPNFLLRTRLPALDANAMSSKYGHERRNRRDKVWTDPPRCLDEKESPRLYSYVVTPDHQVRVILNRQVADRMRRQGLMEAFEAEVRRWRFIVSGHKFMFSWNATSFANANSLSLPKAKTVFVKIRAEAEDRLRIVKQRIRSTGFHTHCERDESGNLVEVLSLSYRELPKFLRRDDVV